MTTSCATYIEQSYGEGWQGWEVPSVSLAGRLAAYVGSETRYGSRGMTLNFRPTFEPGGLSDCWCSVSGSLPLGDDFLMVRDVSPNSTVC